MKRIPFIIISLLCVGAVYSQEAQQENPRRFSLSLGPSVYMAGTDAFWGGGLTFDFTPSPAHLFSIEVRGLSAGSTQIGRYSYTITTQNSSGQTIKTETFDDGEISYNYAVNDAMVSWNRLFALSDKWTLRAGPSIGWFSVFGSDSYSPTSYEGTEIEGIPESQTESKYAFAGAVTAGVRWSFARRWYADMSYRLSFHTGVRFPERSMNVLGQKISVESRDFNPVGNSIGVSLGWRFGREM